MVYDATNPETVIGQGEFAESCLWIEQSNKSNTNKKK